MAGRALWIDITSPLGPDTPVFPGDPPLRLRLASDPSRGDPARVTALEMSAHTGTHVDAPCHVAGGAGGVEALRLDALIGNARVVMARGTISAARVARLPAGPPRLLFKGGPTIEAEAARELARRRFTLVGTDALSIDPLDDTGLPAHRILLAAGVVILEGLRLTRCSPGLYRLIALPLLLPGADGAPARAVVRRIGRTIKRS